MIEQNLYLSGHRRSRTSEALNELNHKQETGPQVDNLALSFTETGSDEITCSENIFPFAKITIQWCH